MPKLLDFINKLRKEQRYKVLNEEATKQSTILPILQMLGWEVFNTDEVYPEFSVNNTRIDYSLRNNGVSKVFIEVKKNSAELDNHQEQLLSYSFKHGVRLSILTNGSLWWFYLPLQEGGWEQRRFYAIDFYSQKPEDVVEKLERFLSKDKVINGDAVNNAINLYGSRKKNTIIKKSLPEAWKKLHIDGDESLIELLSETTEKLCGYKPNEVLVSEFLYSIIGEKITPEKYSTEKAKKKEPKSNDFSQQHYLSLDDNFTFKKIDYFVFDNNKYKARNWTAMLSKTTDIIYKNHKDSFSKVLDIKGKRRLYFSTDINDLRKPLGINDSEYYVETNFSVNNIMKVISSLLPQFGYQLNSIKFKLKEHKNN